MALAIGCPTEATPQDFAIRDVRLFDGERVHARASVLVRDGLIAAVGDVQIPLGVETVDGRGRTLLPGLIESHSHSWELIHLEQALAFGVTTVLDMSSDLQYLADRQREQKEGRASGRADLFSAGTLATAPDGHGTQFGDIPTISGAGEADRFVADRVSDGSDFVKIIYQPCEGCMPSIDESTLRALISAAHRRDMLAVVHIHTLEYAGTALRAGADGLVHLFADREADELFLDLAVGSAAFVVPTLTVVSALGGRSDGAAWAGSEAVARYLPVVERERLGQFNPDSASSSWFQPDSAWANVRLLEQRGVPILTGSDPPNIGASWGAGVHRELALLVDAGLSPTAALRAATSAPARAFRLADRGMIVPGNQADLVLVEGDPTTDIAATTAIVAVWKRGVPFAHEVYRARLDGTR